MATELTWTKRERGQFWKDVDKLRVIPGVKADLKKRPTSYTGKLLDKKRSKQILTWGVEQLSVLHDILYANNQYSLLICLQAMDTAGKDGAIKHIMSGLNPQGVKVTSFKSPSAEELDHDFLWRHYKALPPRGEIGIFNRSHYENVLVSRVHPEFVIHERLPNVHAVQDIDAKFWDQRYASIKKFEELVSSSGTQVLKFYLHLSKEEQRRRLIARIDDPQKNWKFSLSDIKERQYWDAYASAYEHAITATSTDEAPWYVIPADDKWYSRIAIAAIIYRHMQQLKLAYPTVTEEQSLQLLEAKKQLI